MKIRTDFVTNSSSASYILEFKAPEGYNNQDITGQLTSRWVDSGKEYHHWSLDTPLLGEKDRAKFNDYIYNKLESLGDNKWRFTEDTCMHNDYIDDMPSYLLEFTMELLGKDLWGGWEFLNFTRKSG